MARLPVGILISGTGSNMDVLLQDMADPGHPAMPRLVLSNVPQAAGLDKAAARGVDTAVIDHRGFDGDRPAFDRAMDARLRAAGCELVVLAGFMRIMSADMIARWQGRMINIHPSLLPLFRGLDTHARALAAGVAVHGCTVHEVTPELDAGHILGQAVVPVCQGDTPEKLAKRVLGQEHRLYPAVLRRFAQDADAARRAPLALFPPT